MIDQLFFLLGSALLMLSGMLPVSRDALYLMLLGGGLMIWGAAGLMQVGAPL